VRFGAVAVFAGFAVGDLITFQQMGFGVAAELCMASQRSRISDSLARRRGSALEAGPRYSRQQGGKRRSKE
jgi:hypothetical protein